MASIVTSLLTGGAGSLLSGVANVIEAIKGKNPEDAARLQALAMQYKAEFDAAELQFQEKQIDAATQEDSTAGENIRAEITSPDAVVRRARVMPLWICSIVVAVNFIVLPLVRVWMPFTALELPSFFWYLYMFAIGGYVGHAGIDRIMGGQGGELSFLGVTAKSKGD
jgi:hypothetical protein